MVIESSVVRVRVTVLSPVILARVMSMDVLAFVLVIMYMRNMTVAVRGISVMAVRVIVDTVIAILVPEGSMVV